MKERKQQTYRTETTWQDHCARLINQWLEARCTFGAAATGYKTPAADLHADFTRWCAARGVPEMSVTTFGRQLAGRGILVTKGSTGRKERWPIRFGARAPQALAHAASFDTWSGLGG